MRKLMFNNQITTLAGRGKNRGDVSSVVENGSGLMELHL